MKTFRSLGAGALLVCLAGCFSIASLEKSLLPVGSTAPDFTAMKADNSPVKLSDFRGKLVLVDFWATWCGPCLRAMPAMESLHTKLQDQGLVVIGVCVRDSRSSFDAWVKKPKVPTSYLKVFDPNGSSDNSIAWKLYGAEAVPAFYLIDRDGRVAFAAIGYTPEHEAALARALAAAGLKL